MAGIVLPVDTRGNALPVPRYERGIELDYAGSGTATLTWTATQDDVLLFRAVSCHARFRIGSTGIWTHLLSGQALPQAIEAGEVAVLQALEAGRLEIHAYSRSGDGHP